MVLKKDIRNGIFTQKILTWINTFWHSQSIIWSKDTVTWTFWTPHSSHLSAWNRTIHQLVPIFSCSFIPVCTTGHSGNFVWWSATSSSSGIYGWSSPCQFWRKSANLGLSWMASRRWCSYLNGFFQSNWSFWLLLSASASLNGLGSGFSRICWSRKTAPWRSADWQPAHFLAHFDSTLSVATSSSRWMYS